LGGGRRNLKPKLKFWTRILNFWKFGTVHQKIALSCRLIFLTHDDGKWIVQKAKTEINLSAAPQLKTETIAGCYVGLTLLVDRSLTSAWVMSSKAMTSGWQTLSARRRSRRPRLCKMRNRPSPAGFVRDWILWLIAPRCYYGCGN